MMRLLIDLLRRLARPSDHSTAKVIIAVIVVVWYSASGYLYFEIQSKPNLTWADAFWWSFATITTVGYGDLFPETDWGRFLIGIPTMIFGISVLGYLLSSVATYLIESKSKELKGMKMLAIQGHILVVHFSDVNRIKQVVTELTCDPATRGKPIVLIDNELEELPPELVEAGIKFVRGNPSREATLEQANYRHATHAVVLAKDLKDVRSDDLNLAVAMTIEGLNGAIRTVVECVEPESIEVLRRTGCDHIVCASQLSTSLLVQELLNPGLQSVIAEFSNTQIGQQMYVTPIVAMHSWTFAEVARWAREHRGLALGIKRGHGIHLNPEDSFALASGDEVIMLAGQRPRSIEVLPA